MTEKLLGSIEAGGTKFVCGVGTDDLTIVELSLIHIYEPTRP